MPELELKVETVERNGRTVREALGTLSSGLRVRFLVPSNYGLAALWGGMPGLKKLTSADPKAVGETTSEMWKRITAMLEAYTLVPKMVSKPPNEIVDGEMSTWVLSNEAATECVDMMLKALGYDSKRAEEASSVLEGKADPVSGTA